MAKDQKKIKEEFKKAKIRDALLNMREGGVLTENETTEKYEITGKGQQAVNDANLRYRGFLNTIGSMLDTDTTKAIELWKILNYGSTDIPLPEFIDKYLKENNISGLKTMIKQTQFTVC